MTHNQEPNLYEQLGARTIEAVITEFYKRAFEDPMICHFFLDHDRGQLTRKQIAFATGMLGGPTSYRGKPLAAAHADLPIRPPHFGRRQVIMSQVLADLAVEDKLAKAWLQMEENLRPVIFKQRHPS